MTDEDKVDVLRNQSLPHKNRESADIPGMRYSYLLVDFTSSMHLYISNLSRTGDPSIYSLALYHVAIKAGLYRKAVQIYYIPNLYPVTFSPSILNSSSNFQKYKNHWK